NEMMRLRCLEALQMGQVTNEVPTRITVILNPAADAGKARRKYEDYCAPLLHLAGVKGMGQAKEIMGVMKDADAVLVAGGDGTLMETVTGLLRREDAYAKSITLGVLPVGRENRLAKALFSSNADNEVDLMSSATLAALRKLFRPMDALQSEKKLFGLRSLHLGAFRDVSERKNKFWYFGPLQDFFAHVFSYSTSHKEINWDLNGELELSESETLEKTRWPLSLLLGSSITPSKKEAISFKRIYEWASLPHYEGLELFIALTGKRAWKGRRASMTCATIRAKILGLF
ncbi:Acylglycerol kinase_ mitochondriallike, partial [Caligus rogercresseyi]